MAVTIQLRRDTHANLSGSGGATIAPGEIVIDTTTIVLLSTQPLAI